MRFLEPLGHTQWWNRGGSRHERHMQPSDSFRSIDAPPVQYVHVDTADMLDLHTIHICSRTIYCIG